MKQLLSKKAKKRDEPVLRKYKKTRGFLSAGDLPGSAFTGSR